MDKLVSSKRISVSHREWAYFGLRWVIPVALLIHLLSPQPLSQPTLYAILSVGGISVVANLLMLLFLMSDHWSRVATLVMVAVDVLLAVGAVYAAGASLMWIGLVPVIVTGVYFGWMPGMFMGLGVALAMVVVQLVFGPSGSLSDLGLPAMILSLLSLPAAGPIVALLARNEAEISALQSRMKERGRRADQAARLAQEYMRVVYEMSEVLTASKLDPKRVLDSAIRFSLEVLERIGLPAPLYAAMLLFADNEDGVGTILRMARSSLSVPTSDSNVIALGAGGAIAQAIQTSEPAVTQSPDTDPELGQYDSFSTCKSVLVLPLRSGNEAYGVMLVGSPEAGVLKDSQIELMRAIANQAAASLNNVRLYATLLEERDRIVQIEKNTRAQLASDLHDGPTQGVAAITMRLNYVRKLIEKKPESAVNELYAIEDMARRTTKEIRHMLFELRPKALDAGLYSGLDQLAIKMKETYDQNVQIQMQGPIDQMLDTQATQTLFSICSECINNARKHAKATLIKVVLGVREGVFTVEIADNGVGFDVDKALEDAKTREGHLGLLNLQERAALIEGDLTIESAPGKGTRTRVIIPLETIRIRKEEEETRTDAAADQKMVARAATQH